MLQSSPEHQSSSEHQWRPGWQSCWPPLSLRTKSRFCEALCLTPADPGSVRESERGVRWLNLLSWHSS